MLELVFHTLTAFAAGAGALVLVSIALMRDAS